MRNPPALFWLSLAGALGLWAWSRTEEGEDMVRRTSDKVGAGVTAAGQAVGQIVDWGTSRGLRNNNPGNIDRKSGVTWRGMSPDQSADSRFVVFTAPEWGIRAMARVLKTYAGRGIDTIEEVIRTWAPPIENDTGAYVAAVSRSVGLPPNARIGPEHMPALLAAIIKHENGSQPYSMDMIRRGIELEQSA